MSVETETTVQFLLPDDLPMRKGVGRFIDENVFCISIEIDPH